MGDIRVTSSTSTHLLLSSYTSTSSIPIIAGSASHPSVIFFPVCSCLWYPAEAASEHGQRSTLGFRTVKKSKGKKKKRQIPARGRVIAVLQAVAAGAIACIGVLLPCFHFRLRLPLLVSFESALFFSPPISRSPTASVWPKGPAIACHGRAVLRGAVNGAQKNIAPTFVAR